MVNILHICMKIGEDNIRKDEYTIRVLSSFDDERARELKSSMVVEIGWNFIQNKGLELFS